MEFLKRTSPVEGYSGYAIRAGALRQLHHVTHARYVPPPSVVSRDLASAVPSPTFATINMLLDSISAQVVIPALRAPSDEEFFKIIEANWHEFHETVHALHVVVARAASEERAIAVSESTAASSRREIERIARELSGSRGGDEAHFAVETYRNALRIAAKLNNLEASAPKALLDADRKCAEDFIFATTVHAFGTLALHVAVDGDTGATAAGIRNAFLLLRVGALEAYVAARAAFDLRTPPEEDDGEYDALPTDEEDDALASIDD